MNPLGANAWIWVSPLTDERLADLAPRVRAWGFDFLELPIEQHGDWDPARAAEVLRAHELRPTVCVAMGPGRELCATDAGTVASTQAFLKECIDTAAVLGAGCIAGPIYASTGRTWRMSADERRDVYAQLRAGLAPVCDYGAEFLKENVDPGGKILALRILPGVDVLETRWSGAKEIFDDSELDVVGVEFTDGDAAKTKSIVSDYLQREGQLDGIWMDAGATAVAASEAFEDAGLEVPPIVGEDQQDFLAKWKEDGWTAVAPTYSNYQWRTAIIAAGRIIKGEELPGGEWVLPQPKITQENLDEYVQEDMPPLHYALCGCEDMPGFPQKWGGK